MSATTIDIAEKNRILSNLSSMPGHTTTVNRAMAKAVVGHEFVFCGGLVRNIKVKVKCLGVGMYKIFTVKP